MQPSEDARARENVDFVDFYANLTVGEGFFGVYQAGAEYASSNRISKKQLGSRDVTRTPSVNLRARKHSSIKRKTIENTFGTSIETFSAFIHACTCYPK